MPLRRADSEHNAASLASDTDAFVLEQPGRAPVRVTLHVSGSSFSWAPLCAEDDAVTSVPAPDAFAAAWDACWTCVSTPFTELASAAERAALGPAALAGGRLDLADVLGGETRPAAAAGGPTLLDVHYIDRGGSKSDAHRWFLRKLAFDAPTAAAAARIVDALRAVLRGPTFRCRPRSLLVIVSPASGKGRGAEVWSEAAAPVFAAAGVACRVVHTARRGDAYDVARTLAARIADSARPGAAAAAAAAAASASPPPLPPLPQRAGSARVSPRPGGSAPPSPGQHAPHLPGSALDPGPADVDGVLVVGGDGTFNEVLNGLMARQDWGRLAAAKLRFGAIPAGSTDAVACTLHGTRDARTAAAHAALGGTQPMDALRLDGADGTLRWASNFAGYGFYGDVIAMSEWMRWMGPARYGAAGAFAFLRLQSYVGTLEYLPADTASSGGAGGSGSLSDDEARATLLRRRRGAESPCSSPPPRSRRLSAAGAAADSCDSLATAGDDDALSDDGHDAPAGATSPPHHLSTAGLPSLSGDASDADGCRGDEAPDVPLRSSLERSSSLPPKSARRTLLPGSGSGSAVQLATSLSSSPGASASQAPPAGWRAVPGPFHVVACAAISCRNDAAPHGIAPRAALADGCADLIAVRDCSRPAYLRHLLRLARPELGDHLELPFVTAVKARAVRFTPALGGAVSRWNCDGELLPPSANALQATVQPRLLTMFAFTPDDVK